MESPLSKFGNTSPVKSDINQQNIGVADLKLLRVFKTVVEAGGFTAASNDLNIGLAAISKQISDLEIRFGMKLCTRGREGFYLTEHGKVAYQACLDLFSSINQFRDTLNHARREIFGELNIGIIDNTITDRKSPVVGALSEIHRQAPKVSVRLHATQLEEIERGVIDGRFTCGIIPVYEEKTDFDYFFLYNEISHLCCSYQHDLFTLAPESLTDARIESASLIKHFYTNHSHQNPTLHFQPSNAVAVQVEAVTMLILTGNYVGFLPEHYISRFVSEGKIKALKPEDIYVTTPFHLVVKKGAAQNAVMKLFLDALKHEPVVADVHSGAR
ncbi:LysR family transcriptional regulator [Acerihabitans sp. TG2]|uniref:LysR family transcriptional regulator n=1 Tax=Acerihabitans sp. TG2 TaxID=3096008 RepID=UPI002B22F35A|nr:LysR family transcriptional regulator [Acerihabitans sp. TG2]MEA9390432.1 LysR family transcriptional regulator [Acerihabitans sp. TG2]